MLWVGSIFRAPISTGIVGVVAVALLAVAAALRSYQALFRNERYRFTTWRWGLVLAGFVAIGIAIKVLS